MECKIMNVRCLEICFSVVILKRIEKQSSLVLTTIEQRNRRPLLR